MVLIAISGDDDITNGGIITQSILDTAFIQHSKSVKQVIIINLTEVLSRTPGHFIRRVQIQEIIRTHIIQDFLVITPFKYYIMVIQKFVPLLHDRSQNLGFDTIPGDMEGVVELTILVVSGNSVGAGPEKEEITIWTPGLVELIPDRLEVLPLILSVRYGFHLRPHPDILIQETVRVSLHGIPKVYQVSVDVGTDTPVHIVTRGTQQLDEDGTSPTERFIICVYKAGKILDDFFTLNPPATNPFH